MSCCTHISCFCSSRISFPLRRYQRNSFLLFYYSDCQPWRDWSDPGWSCDLVLAMAEAWGVSQQDWMESLGCWDSLGFSFLKWTSFKPNHNTVYGQTTPSYFCNWPTAQEKEQKQGIGRKGDFKKAHALNVAQTGNPKITQAKCWNYFKTTTQARNIFWVNMGV